MQLNINCVNTTKVCFWETWVGILLETLCLLNSPAFPGEELPVSFKTSHEG